MDLRNTPFLQGFLGATSPAGYQSLGLQQQQLQALEAARAWEQQFKQQQFTQNAMQFDQGMANADRRFGLDERTANRLDAGQQFDMERMQSQQAANEAFFRAMQQQNTPHAGMPGSDQMGPPDPWAQPRQFNFDPALMGQASPHIQQAAIQRAAQDQRSEKFDAALYLLKSRGIPIGSREGDAILTTALGDDLGVRIPSGALGLSEAQYGLMQLQIQRLDQQEADIRDALLKAGGSDVAFNEAAIRYNPYPQLGFDTIDSIKKANAVINVIHALRQQVMQDAGVGLPNIFGGGAGQPGDGMGQPMWAPGMEPGFGGGMQGGAGMAQPPQPAQAPASVGGDAPRSREERKESALGQISEKLRERQTWYSNQQ